MVPSFFSDRVVSISVSSLDFLRERSLEYEKQKGKDPKHGGAKNGDLLQFGRWQYEF